MSKPFTVITTINPPNKTVDVLSKSMEVIIVGDKKTDDSKWLKWELSYLNPNKDPYNSYARKNFGYLEAIKNKATQIFDTDDDNIPNKNWKVRSENCEAVATKQKGWCNVYNYFSTDNIWQRGIPLNRLYDSIDTELSDSRMSNFPIQQGMVDGDPDIDAICRMVIKPTTKFSEEVSISVPKGTWSPFNSQSTWWFPKAYPLMYLPQTVNFRMCDIWRSFVAQRCLWEENRQLVFHSPAEVVQERNEHNLMKDFEDEISGYLHNERIAQILGDLKLGKDICGNIVKCYEALMKEQIVSWKEKEPLRNWITQIEKM